MGGGGGDTTTVQDIPEWARPFYTTMYNSAFGAGRTSAGQPGYTPQYRQTQAWGQGYQPAYYQQAGQPPGVSPQTAAMQNAPGMPGGGQVQQQAFGQPIQGGQTLYGQMRPGRGMRPGGMSLNTQGYGGGQFPLAQVPPGSQLTLNQQQGQGGLFNQLGQGGGQVGGQFGPAPGDIVGPSFTGPFTAPPSQIEQLALQQKGLYGAGLQGVEQGLLGTGLAQAGGAFLHPESNPYLQGAMEAAMRPVVSAYERYAPQARSQAIQSGAYKGSSRRDLLESELQSQLQQNLGDVGREMMMQNYAGERQLQQNAGQLLDQAIRLGQVSPEMMLQAGAGMRGLEQMRLEEQLRQYEESIAAPFRPIMSVAQIIRGQPTGTETRQSYGAGGLGGGIIGALGGAAGGAAVGQAAGGYGGLGAGLGAILGGLGGSLA